MNLITELYPYFKKADKTLGEKTISLIFSTPFDNLSENIIPNDIFLDRRLNILLDCAGIKTAESKRRFFAEMYYLYLKGCFK
jgi:hypothetical protein